MKGQKKREMLVAVGNAMKAIGRHNEAHVAYSNADAADELVELADFLWSKKRIHEASDAYEDGGVDPRDKVIGYADRLHKRGRFLQAASLYLHAGANDKMVGAFLDSGDFAQAIIVCMRIGTTDLFRCLAGALAERGYVELAELVDAHGMRQPKPTLLVQSGCMLLGWDLPEQASTLFAEARQPMPSGLLVACGDRCCKSGRRRSALFAYTRARAARKCAVLGRLLMAEGVDLSLAFDAFVEAPRLTPQRTWVQLGDMLRKAKQHDMAIMAYEYGKAVGKLLACGKRQVTTNPERAYNAFVAALSVLTE